jgi:AraC-like DNA-binding protein
MPLATNGSNGRGTDHSEAMRSVGETRVHARDDERPASYAGALILAPLAESDIIDLVRRGFTVRPFLGLDSVFAALALGQCADATKSAFDPDRSDRATTATPSSRSDSTERSAERSAQVAADRTYTGEFASQICTRLDPSLPSGPVRDFFHLCARKTRRRLTVDQAAQAIGIERTKLTALLNEARYPAADEVIRWLRLLHAVWLLNRTPRRSIDEVAKALDFASGPSMSNTMKNVLGMRPTEIAERGGYDLVAVTFRRMLEQVKDRPPSAEPHATA